MEEGQAWIGLDGTVALDWIGWIGILWMEAWTNV